VGAEVVLIACAALTVIAIAGLRLAKRPDVGAPPSEPLTSEGFVDQAEHRWQEATAAWRQRIQDDPEYRRRLEQKLHERLTHRDRAATARPRIAAAVMREVFERDGGRCRHCGAASDLQYDHVVPFSKGGGHTAANLQLLCGPCNRRKGAGFG
jgi:5-methylcytosine-specific restriction endonuclease McrA